ncbi:efflux RND transporter periplasmic adaptor subunit [Ottowia thiooxydans]|uniref:Membrane fusion protein (Multidrug efflux system) n=1 Tax=Ottowia thiooxydans TaxID=219182 RepID=A0ABV2QG87_9BURK
MSDTRAVRFSLPPRLLPVGAAVLLALSLAACGKKDEGAPAGGAPGGGMPPPQVGVVTVQPGSVALVTELPGRLEASRVAQVRARAAGILQKRLFQEGSDVKAGQALFAIDPAPYNAALMSSQATVARAQANLQQAAALADRYKPLVEANAVSKQEYANAVAARAQAEADVQAGRAAVETARINLGYASVTAPISGRIGRALVTEGALVGQGEATQLAVIQQINPLYVNVTQSANEVMKLRQALQSGQLSRAGGGEAVKVQVLLEDGSVYGSPGRLLFSDLSVDPATGQISLRAEVPNPQGMLLPGMYVRARIEQAQVNNAILLPQQAVTRGGKGDSVLVVAADGSFAPRPVKVGEAQGKSWVILDGLKAGEQVIVDGVMKLMPGVKTVKAVPWQEGKPAAAAPAQPASAPQNPASGAPAAQAPASAASK